MIFAEKKDKDMLIAFLDYAEAYGFAGVISALREAIASAHAACIPVEKAHDCSVCPCYAEECWQYDEDNMADVSVCKATEPNKGYHKEIEWSDEKLCPDWCPQILKGE
jgi:hypothetical protein